MELDRREGIDFALASDEARTEKEVFQVQFHSAHINDQDESLIARDIPSDEDARILRGRHVVTLAIHWDVS